MEQTQTDYRSGNRRIAKNTLVVYGQLMLRLILGLYTSRLALEALGAYPWPIPRHDPSELLDPEAPDGKRP